MRGNRDGHAYLRITEEEREMLQYLRDKTGRTFSDIMRDGIRLSYILERCRAEAESMIRIIDDFEKEIFR